MSCGKARNPHSLRMTKQWGVSGGASAFREEVAAMTDFFELGISGHLVVSGGTARTSGKAHQRGNDRRAALLPRFDVMSTRPLPHRRRFVAEHQT